MQRSDQQDRAGEGVRRHHLVMRLSIGGDAAALGEPARPSDIGLHDVDRAAVDQLAEAVEPVLGFVARYWRRERIGDARAAIDVVGRDRLLDPIELLRLHRTAHLDREIGAPRAVDVDHQLCVWAQRLARGGDPRQIFRGIDLAEFGLPDELTQMRAGRRIAADLHLHALEAAGAVALHFAGEIGGRFAFLIKAAAGIGLDAVAAGAEEAVYRQFGDLAGDVPQRDVDAADRVHENAAATELPGACEHLLPEMLDQQRILADEQRLEASFDDGRGDTATDPSLADSDDA